MRTDALYIAYWSLRDPLTQSQVLPVLRGLTAGGRRLALITFEQAAWRMQAAEEERTHADLVAEGISWTPLKYHRWPPILATLLDILVGTATATYLVWRKNVRLLHGRGTVAAAIAFLAARISGRPFFYDADGPLSEEYVDAGVWKRGSLGHLLTGKTESVMLRAADAVAVLSEPRRRQIASEARQAVIVLPCAVDSRLFAFDPAARQRYRATLGLVGTVLVYAGKSKGWYLTDQMLDFLATARRECDSLQLLVLTNEPAENFRRGASERGLPTVIRPAARAEMPGLLSAADAGLSFVLPSPSKAACSPVKNGEYLACGLPIVTTAGIGDYSDLVRREAVGVVVDDLSEPGYRRSAQALFALLRDKDLASRCRRIALRHVGLHEVVLPRYHAVYDELVGLREGTS